MATAVQPGSTWDELVDHTTQWLTSGRFGVFDQPRIIVGSHGAGRLLSQALASRLPGRITAGVNILTPPGWIRSLARLTDAEPALDQWQSASLELQVWQELSRLAASGEFPVLSHHIVPQGVQLRPHRSLIMARRVTRLFLRYVHHAPQMVERWIDGEFCDAATTPLPDHQLWQPSLMAHLVDATGAHPVRLFKHLEAAAAQDEAPTLAVGLHWLSTVEAQLLAAAENGGALQQVQWQPPRGHSKTKAEVHGSHDPHRQAQVLRDILARYFQDDPTLEPRDVALVSPQPEQWRSVLHSLFAAIPGLDDHPARALRVSADPSVATASSVMRALQQIIGLGDSRATSEDLVRLLTMQPIASRWRLDSTRLVELLSAVELRWGLDAQHRETHGLAGLTQNTWTRAVDRLLVSVALGSRPALEQIVGVDAVASTDTRLIGALSEVLSRLRRFVGISAQPATPSEWAQRLLALAGDLFDDRGENGWQVAQAQEQLSGFVHQTRAVSTTLSRGEFSRIFEELMVPNRFRPSVGNGTIQLLHPGEVLPAAHRVVIFLGIQDSWARGVPDEVEIDALDEHALMLEQIEAQAHAATRVAFLYASRNHANTPLARPTTIDHILSRLDVEAVHIEHPPSARDVSQFLPDSPHRSFDSTAARLAIRASRPDEVAQSPAEQRRRVAMAPPSIEQPEQPSPLQLQEIIRFLKHPAADFLRHRVGLRLFQTPALSTRLPLDLDGLQQWRVRENLLDSLKAGVPLHEAQEQERFREALPPGRLGRNALGGLSRDVEDLWHQARNAWEAPVETHRLHLPTVRGSVTTRGGNLVEVATSAGPGSLVKAWLELLALAASGISATALIFQLRREYRTYVVHRTRLVVPTDAARLLDTYVHTVRTGRTRLLPVPQDPALDLLRTLAEPDPDLTDWHSPEMPWRSPWPKNRRSAQWTLFFDGPATELLQIPPQPQDTHLPPSPHGAFGAWAQTLYAPLLRASEAM